MLLLASILPRRNKRTSLERMAVMDNSVAGVEERGGGGRGNDISMCFCCVFVIGVVFLSPMYFRFELLNKSLTIVLIIGALSVLKA